MAAGIRIRLVLGALRLGLGASVANPYRGRRIRLREMGGVGSQSRWRKKSVRSFRYGLATALRYRYQKVETRPSLKSASGWLPRWRKKRGSTFRYGLASSVAYRPQKSLNKNSMAHRLPGWLQKSVETFSYALATAVAYRRSIRRKFLAVRIGYRGNGCGRFEESGADWLPGLATGLERVQSLEMPSEVAN
jgi:hypothetical protein